MEIKEELIQRCLKKDRASQKALYEILLPYLNAVCRRYLFNPSDLKDTLQETFINIFRNIEQFDSERSQFKTWSVKIAIHASLKMNAQMNKMETIELTPKAQNFVSPEVYRDMSNEELLNFLKTMPKQLFEVFNLRFIEAYSHQEIAEILGIGMDLSRKRMSRAKKWLKDHVSIDTIDTVGIRKIG